MKDSEPISYREIPEKKGITVNGVVFDANAEQFLENTILGELVYALRVENALSQGRTAKIMGITHQGVGYLEKQGRSPMRRTRTGLLKLVDAFPDSDNAARIRKEVARLESLTPSKKEKKEPKQKNRTLLGEQLSAFMEERGLSQESLADHVGVSFRTLRYWITEKKPQAGSSGRLKQYLSQFPTSQTIRNILALLEEQDQERLARKRKRAARRWPKK